MSHPLQNTWVVWELKQPDGSKGYSKALREVCEFNTVEDFWKFWMFIPKPSEAFGDGVNKKLIEGRTIKAFLLFKKGINPEWEDPANKNGSELTAQKSVHVEVMDFYWENLVLGLIGETIDEGDQICGCRIVNQTRKTKPTYKLELWLKTAEEETCNKFRTRLLEVLTDGDSTQAGKIKALDFELLRRK